MNNAAFEAWWEANYAGCPQYQKWANIGKFVAQDAWEAIENTMLQKLNTLKEASNLMLSEMAEYNQQYPHMVKGYVLDAMEQLKAALKEAENGAIAEDASDTQTEAQKFGMDLWSGCKP